MNVLTLKQQLQVIDWLKAHKSEIVNATHDDICGRIFADTGVTLKVWALRRIDRDAALNAVPGRGKARVGTSKDRYTELAFLAKTIRHIGTQLGCLSKDDVEDLTTIIARRRL